jgi:ABC-type multidrug transport system ATPase subunit
VADDTTPVQVIGTGLGKRYANGTWGLRDLDLRVLGGTFLAVIGHNGAGKSTLLNMLGGVLRPTSGRLEVQPRGVQPSWSPQRVLVDWSLTVRQNVELSALLASHRMPAARVRPMVDEVLELLDLAKVAGQEAENLSGGQLQRVQIARALACESRLYVMDEPAAGLDPAAADLVMNHLRGKARLGAAVVVSSHDLDAVERTADHLLLLDNGSAVADLPVPEFVASTGGRMAVTVALAAPAAETVDVPESWTVSASDDRLSLVFDVPISVAVGEVLAMVPRGCPVADLDVRRQSLRDVYLARHARPSPLAVGEE